MYTLHGARLMQREYADYIDGTNVYYAIGAKRAAEQSEDDTYKTYTADKIKADKIKTITFQNTAVAPTDFVVGWDVSYTSGAQEVMAWLVPNATDSTMYDLYIGGVGGIVSPVNSYGLFRGYENCTTINGLALLDTSNATNMSSVFYDCSSLTSLDVSSFNTSNVTTIAVV